MALPEVYVTCCVTLVNSIEACALVTFSFDLFFVFQLRKVEIKHWTCCYQNSFVLEIKQHFKWNTSFRCYLKNDIRAKIKNQILHYLKSPWMQQNDNSVYLRCKSVTKFCIHLCQIGFYFLKFVSFEFTRRKV